MSVVAFVPRRVRDKVPPQNNWFPVVFVRFGSPSLALHFVCVVPSTGPRLGVALPYNKGTIDKGMNGRKIAVFTVLDKDAAVHLFDVMSAHVGPTIIQVGNVRLGWPTKPIAGCILQHTTTTNTHNNKNEKQEGLDYSHQNENTHTHRDARTYKVDEFGYIAVLR